MVKPISTTPVTPTPPVPDAVDAVMTKHRADLQAVVDQAHAAPAVATLVTQLAAVQAQVRTLPMQIAAAEGPLVQKAKRMLDALDRVARFNA